MQGVKFEVGLGFGLGLGLQGYLAHKIMPTPLGPSYDPRHRSTVESQWGALPREQDTHVGLGLGGPRQLGRLVQGVGFRFGLGWGDLG